MGFWSGLKSNIKRTSELSKALSDSDKIIEEETGVNPLKIHPRYISPSNELVGGRFNYFYLYSDAPLNSYEVALYRLHSFTITAFESNANEDFDFFKAATTRFAQQYLHVYIREQIIEDLYSMAHERPD